MKRGDFVTVALQGDLGKPRPALVIQADAFESLKTVTVLPITGSLVNAPLLRIALEPSDTNGLQKPSQLMVDKTITVLKDKIGQVIGKADAPTMIQVERALAVFLGVV
jgi:mRNA interferase MazF